MRTSWMQRLSCLRHSVVQLSGTYSVRQMLVGIVHFADQVVPVLGSGSVLAGQPVPLTYTSDYTAAPAAAAA